jgi:predicted small secreted protein
MARVGGVVAVLVTLTMALAACGDDKEQKNAYVRQVNAAQTEFASTITKVSQSITQKSSAAEDQRTLRRFEAAIDNVVGDLRGIEVPEDVESEHGRLVAAISGFGDDISKANEALRDPTTRTLELAQQRIAKATRTVNARIDSAIASINVKLESST